MAALSSLTALVVSHNERLSFGASGEALAALPPGLQLLDASACRLETFPLSAPEAAGAGALHGLTSLNLQGNKTLAAGATAASTVSGLPALRRFSLAGCSVLGMPGDLPRLTYLCLRSGITGGGELQAGSLAGLPRLKCLVSWHRG